MAPDPKAALAQKVLTLKGDVERAATLRAQAETTLQHAKQQAAKIDEQLRALGVEPDQAEQHLANMEQLLDRKVDELSVAVAAEVKAYTEIVEASKQAFA